jgi:Cullin binding
MQSLFGTGAEAHGGAPEAALGARRPRGEGLPTSQLSGLPSRTTASRAHARARYRTPLAETVTGDIHDLPVEISVLAPGPNAPTSGRRRTHESASPAAAQEAAAARNTPATASTATAVAAFSRKRRADVEFEVDEDGTTEDSSSVGLSGFETLTLLGSDRYAKRSRTASHLADSTVVAFDPIPEAGADADSSVNRDAFFESSNNDGSEEFFAHPQCPRSATPDCPDASSQEMRDTFEDDRPSSLAGIVVGTGGDDPSSSSSDDESGSEEGGEMAGAMLDLPGATVTVDWNRVNELLAESPRVCESQVAVDSVQYLLTQISQQTQQALPISLKTGYRALFDDFSLQESWRGCQRRGQMLTATAVDLWAALFRNPCVWLDFWFAYLLSADVMHITRDSWDLFLDFVNEHGADAQFDERYDSTSAWPVTFDEFALWYRMRR